MTAKFPEKTKRCSENKDCRSECYESELAICQQGFCICDLKQEFEVDFVVAETEKNEIVQPHQTGL